MSDLSRRGHAEQLGDVATSTAWTVGQITGGADQGLKGMFTGLTVILVERHTWTDSSIS
jgi:hypothetical protein